MSAKGLRRLEGPIVSIDTSGIKNRKLTYDEIDQLSEEIEYAIRGKKMLVAIGKAAGVAIDAALKRYGV